MCRNCGVREDDQGSSTSCSWIFEVCYSTQLYLLFLWIAPLLLYYFLCIYLHYIITLNSSWLISHWIAGLQEQITWTLKSSLTQLLRSSNQDWQPTELTRKPHPNQCFSSHYPTIWVILVMSPLSVTLSSPEQNELLLHHGKLLSKCTRFCRSRCYVSGALNKGRV